LLDRAPTATVAAVAALLELGHAAGEERYRFRDHCSDTARKRSCKSCSLSSGPGPGRTGLERFPPEFLDAFVNNRQERRETCKQEEEKIQVGMLPIHVQSAARRMAAPKELTVQWVKRAGRF